MKVKLNWATRITIFRILLIIPFVSFMLPPTVVVLIIGKDLFLLIGFVIVYLITSKIHIAPVFVGKLATTLQLSMVAGILIGPEVSGILPGWIWFLRILWWSAAGTAILVTLIYTRDGSRYIEEYEQNLANKNENYIGDDTI